MRELHFRNLNWLIIAAIVILLDQLTKHLILQHFELGDSWQLLPVLNLTLAFNHGAAFSLLGSRGDWVPWLFTAIAVSVSGLLVYWLLQQEKSSRIMPLALSCIIGGAIGNVWDRLQHGVVIDFIHVHWMQHSFPIFNVADSAICIGAGLILLVSFRE